MPVRRRDLVIAAIAIGSALALPRVLGLFTPEFEFDPIPGLPGFRRLAGGPVSGAPVVLAGIDPVSKEKADLWQEAANDICRAAFGPTEWPDGTVPVAVFTDYNCPYCPTLSATVMDLIASDAPISVSWHDLPVLGARSTAAARAAVAAREQGQYLPVHTHLMRSVLPPGPAAQRALAGRFDMNPVEFQHDVDSKKTTHSIDRSSALAAVLGIIGTPSLLVGRTVVTGNIDIKRLKSLITLEQHEAGQFCRGCPMAGGSGTGATAWRATHSCPPRLLLQSCRYLH